MRALPSAGRCVWRRRDGPVIFRTLVLPLLLALLFSVYAGGYAFSRLLLPDELRPYRWLLAPLAGCALFVLVAAGVTIFSALVPAYAAAGLAVAVTPLTLWALW